MIAPTLLATLAGPSAAVTAGATPGDGDLFAALVADLTAPVAAAPPDSPDAAPIKQGQVPAVAGTPLPPDDVGAPARSSDVAAPTAPAPLPIDPRGGALAMVPTTSSCAEPVTPPIAPRFVRPAPPGPAGDKSTSALLAVSARVADPADPVTPIATDPVAPPVSVAAPPPLSTPAPTLDKRSTVQPSPVTSVVRRSAIAAAMPMPIFLPATAAAPAADDPDPSAPHGASGDEPDRSPTIPDASPILDSAPATILLQAIVAPPTPLDAAPSPAAPAPPARATIATPNAGIAVVAPDIASPRSAPAEPTPSTAVAVPAAPAPSTADAVPVAPTSTAVRADRAATAALAGAPANPVAPVPRQSPLPGSSSGTLIATTVPGAATQAPIQPLATAIAASAPVSTAPPPSPDVAARVALAALSNPPAQPPARDPDPDPGQRLAARTPAAAASITLASAQPVAVPAIGATAPARQLFAAAIEAAGRQQAGTDQPVEIALPIATPLAPAPQGVGAAPSTGDQPSLDMRHNNWPGGMIAHIEKLRDAADAGDTRIRFVPDALGGIDVSLRRYDDGVQVTLAADQPATRAMLAEARPQLTQMAEARGISLADAPPGGIASTGGASAGAGDASTAGGWRQPPSQQSPATPTPRPRAAATDDDANPADRRVA